MSRVTHRPAAAGDREAPSVLPTLVAVVVALIGCGRGAEAPDAAATDSPDKAAISEAWAAYRDILVQGDAEGLASLFTPDGILMEPARADIEGREAIEAFAADAFARSRILAIETTSRELHVSGTRAFELGSFTEVVEMAPGPALESAGRYAAVWMRVGGQWKIHRLLVSPVPAATRGS